MTIDCIDIAGVALVAALVYVVVQHVVLRRLQYRYDDIHDALRGIILGRLEGKVDPDGGILLRTKKEKNNGYS